ncbi:MAG: hypothetical protein COU69_01575 [Candidatus Pacebacteria bacterium CG10_big_fil_rev_8_21_14_0_10_56_10]|nr:MAG: hypothetical protein COU69_01575 [Candidatus Pacebacteria bacterium CG10_big_fil_rev_8_21_14_0_10_56_10]
MTTWRNLFNRLANDLTANKRVAVVVIGLVLLAGWLRLSNLSSLPPAPYWEEVALGYDAYSILKTGRDHHGHSWPLVAFESFGDWKPSGYFYALVPFIAVLDLSVQAVRLPAAVAGWLSVIGVGVLAWQLADLFFERRWRMGLTAAAVLAAATSPWGVQFSRGGWEVTLATLFIILGVISWLKFTGRQLAEQSDQALEGVSTRWLLASIAFLGLAMYTYQAARLIVPLMVPGLVLIWWWRSHGSLYPPRPLQLGQAFLARHRRQLLLAVVTGLVMTAPIIIDLNSPTVSQRFTETSVLHLLEPIETSNSIQQAAGHSLLSRLFAHRYLVFGRVIAGQFLSHFRPDFLFLSGDVNPRHSVQLFGQLLYSDVVWLTVGAVVILRRRSWAGWLLGWWLVAGIVPASLTRTVPHALRILPSWPVWMLMIAIGMTEVLRLAHQLIASLPALPRLAMPKRAALGVLAAAVVLANLVQIGWWWRVYSGVYPKQHGREWQVGYRQMVIAIEQLRADHQQLPLYVTREQGRPAMYYWFYTRTDPSLVQTAQETARLDQGEFLTFNQFSFVRSMDEVPVGPAIVAASPQQWAGLEQRLVSQPVTAQPVSIIVDTADQPVWTVGLLSAEVP